MLSVPKGLSALTHNPLLLYYNESTERTINPLHTTESVSSHLHKDIKETEGEHIYNIHYSMPLLSACLTIFLLSPVSSSILVQFLNREGP